MTAHSTLRSLGRIFYILGALVGDASASAQSDGRIEITPREQPVSDPPGDLRFETLDTKFGAGQVQLANGDEVDTALWPALVVAERSSTSFCTGTLIGPRVLLTAAHCVDARNGAKPDATVGVSVTTARGVFKAVSCAMHHAYVAAAPPKRRQDPRSSADFALCELDDVVADTLFETLAADTPLDVGSDVLMTGYGCTSVWVAAGVIEFGAHDRALRMGMGTLDAVATKDALGRPGDYVRSASRQHAPVLCSGDSGGPMIVGTTLASPTPRHRRVAGVNSKVTALEAGAGHDFYSFMAPVSGGSFRSFVHRWQSEPRPAGYRAICGADLQPGERNCRG